MKKSIYLLQLLVFFAFGAFSQSNIQQATSINSDGAAPAASAMLDVQATDKVMLVPRMTTAQRLGIPSLATGLLVPLAAVLPSLMKLQAKSYFYKSAPEQKPCFGFIAQEVEPLFPELVTPSIEDGGRQSNYLMSCAGFGVLAVKAVQEQQQIIEAQHAENAANAARFDKIAAALQGVGIAVEK
jgi:hypothetical protein